MSEETPHNPFLPPEDTRFALCDEVICHGLSNEEGSGLRCQVGKSGKTIACCGAGCACLGWCSRRRITRRSAACPGRRQPDPSGAGQQGAKAVRPRQVGDTKKDGRARRAWRKLHLAIDAGTGEIAAHMLTKSYADDAAQVPALLGQTEGVIPSVTADEAYDAKTTCAAAGARQRHPPPAVVVPPQVSAMPGSRTTPRLGMPEPRRSTVHNAVQTRSPPHMSRSVVIPSTSGQT